MDGEEAHKRIAHTFLQQGQDEDSLRQGTLHRMQQFLATED
jgi:hypothetical protein